MPRDIDSLYVAVKAMRELGVMQWGDIVLGPEPQKADDTKPAADDDRAAKRAHYNNLLGHQHTDAELDRLP